MLDLLYFYLVDSLMGTRGVKELRPFKEYLSAVEIEVEFIMSVFLSQKVIEDKIFPNFLVLDSLQANCYLQSQVISFLSFFKVHFANLPCLLINFKLS